MSESIERLGLNYDPELKNFVITRFRNVKYLTSVWFVTFGDVILASFEKKDSKWVHDNWLKKFTKEGAARFLTRENRAWFDKELQNAMWETRKAYKNRITTFKYKVDYDPNDPINKK
jgi:hypothetical protein